ncbi:MAG: hypothetical protein AAB423_01925 [Patescibacteria group bacterium]
MSQALNFKKLDQSNKYFQAPNLPIIVWLLCLVLAKVTDGQVQSLFSVISFGALFTWSWLEIFYGTHNFRRILGVVVIILATANRV